MIRGEAFEAALNEFCAGDDPRPAAAARDLRRRRAAADADERLRDAPLRRPASSTLELGERPSLEARLEELAEAARVPRRRRRTRPTRRGRPRRRLLALAESRDAARAAARPQRPPGARRASCELRGSARSAVEQAALDELALRDRELLQELLRRLRRRSTRRRRIASRRSTSRISSCTRATCCATTRACASASSCASARSWSTSSRTRTGSSASWSTCSPGPDTERLLRRRRVPVDLRLPARRRAGLPRAARARPTTLLPLTRNYRSRPEVLAVVNHLFGAEFGEEFQPLAASGEFPDPVFGTPGRAARDRQGGVRGHRRPLAPCRGEARRAARQGARRHGRCDARARSSSSSPPARTPSGTRRSCAAPASPPTAPPAAATSASSRSSTCSRTCACSRTATTTRRSSACSPRRSSASPTTRCC